MSGAPVVIDVAAARDLAISACLKAGASPAVAGSLADATVSAACFGHAGMGFPHLLDYLSSFREDRIRGDAVPAIDCPAPAIIHADAMGGIAQLGFDLAFDRLAEAACRFGVALFAQKNCYTAGELGYYVRRLAMEGLVSLAAANGPALLAAAPGTPAVYCTNPVAFGAPVDGGDPPLVIDQASSATAFVNLVRAAREGQAIPEGWAVDAHGDGTTDPSAALRGALLAFGGSKGANIALLVEVLSAGLAGASWSLDSPSFLSGDRPPNAGLTVVIISPTAISPDFGSRLANQLRRLEHLGVHIPGRRSKINSESGGLSVVLDRELFEEIRRQL